MSEVVLRATDLRCAYPNQPGIALQIDDFSLIRGNTHFVLGRSGIGKSTLIESLGLMEQTAQPHADSSVELVTQKASHDLMNMWTQAPSKLAEFRQKHFSFIFQSTNLLPHLTLKDNVLMPAWIAGVQDEENLDVEFEGMFQRLLREIPKSEWNKDVTAISGGQRQRLAFMRALMSPFSVLFGDEPTGNLDAWKADQAMSLLNSELKLKNGTACIVSHDIPLALKYADAIHLLTPAFERDCEIPYGQLKPENEFFKVEGGWQSKSGKLWNSEQLKTQLNRALIES